eukprot:TRINITY_DN14303_c0_g1_i2.p1 TRINITY_DN14303_c0_g1~~TRINITY_DN14303_c0_g1_i2.p1  ORF type:complete len:467 (-),score=83.78 TRINITY_DN14303_c0_g1_i2:84-1484(-)
MAYMVDANAPPSVKRLTSMGSVVDHARSFGAGLGRRSGRVVPPSGEGWATPEAAQWLAYRKGERIISAAAVPSTSRAAVADLQPLSSSRSRPGPSEAKSSLQAASRSRQEPPEASSGQPEAATGRLQALPPDAAAPSNSISRRHRQPHILSVELGEMLLNSAALDLQLAWYESVSYLVTLQPSSVKLPNIQLPRDVPHATPAADHMASQWQASQSSRSNEHDGSLPSDNAMPDRYQEQSSVQFLEMLTMHADRLDSHFVLFLWCRRRSVFSESTVLLGCRPLPLRDPSLYARWAAWDIHDMETGEEVGQVRLKIDVLTAPGPIRLPHLSDVMENGFTLNWSTPLGAPPTGYAVAIRVRGRHEAILVEQSSSTSFIVDGLLSATTYVVDIRAGNEVGWGEGCELEASTLGVLDESCDVAENSFDSERTAESVATDFPQIEETAPPERLRSEAAEIYTSWEGRTTVSM